MLIHIQNKTIFFKEGDTFQVSPSLGIQEGVLRFFLMQRYFLFLYCIVATLFVSFPLLGQNTNIGAPFTTNFSNDQYNAGTQNWTIDQHPNGFLYFANNNGLLQFDGTNWQVFSLPNKTIVRSLTISQDKKIYVGGQGEFGYFYPNQTGQLSYQSLLDSIPTAHRAFSDVWKIVECQGKIYFNASDKIYEYHNGAFKIYEKGKIKFIEAIEDQLYVGNEMGLSSLVDNQIALLDGGEQVANQTIRGLVKGNGQQLIIATLKMGLFALEDGTIRPFLQEETAYFEEHSIYTMASIDEERLAIGMVHGGLFIMDKAGRLLYHLTKKNCLQNNNVISIFKDKETNLWVGLENGIDFIAIASPFSKIMPDRELEGAAYAAAIHKDQIYLGTSTGLYNQQWQAYYSPMQKQEFQLIKGSKGQVWGLDQINNQLLLGHHEAGFVVKPQQIQPFSASGGIWTFLPLSKHPNHLIVGTYEGLELYQFSENKWTFVKKYEGIAESCRFLVEGQQDIIWIAHPYRGIYKAKLAPDLSTIEVRLYGEKDGLPSDNFNHVFKINEEVVFTGESGVFRYDMAQDSFLHYTVLENIIGEEQNIQRLFEDATGNIWFSSLTETGILKVEDKGVSKNLSKVVYPQLNEELVRGFELIYPYDEYNVFIGAEKGFIHFNPSKVSSSTESAFPVNITQVEVMGKLDSTLLLGPHIPTTELDLSHDLNAFKFNYSAPLLHATKNVQYATQLEGFDQHWSKWHSKTEKEYTNLSPGTYRFLVKAMSDKQRESRVAAYSFTIAAPWYASTAAIALYTLLGLLLLGSLIFIPQQRFEKEKAQMQSEQERQEKVHQATVAQNEHEITVLKNKNLEAKIAHKNRELALNAMHTEQRNDLIQKLQDPLQKILKKTKDQTAITEIKRINRLLNEDARLEENWDQVVFHFEQVHTDFFKKLRAQYPALTTKEQRLCAYLRMNLSTKEIAPLMNISVRGVEVSRYRLRKKLELDSGVNLNNFINGI